MAKQQTTVAVELNINGFAEQFKIKYKDIRMLQIALVNMDCTKCPHGYGCDKNSYPLIYGVLRY